jgi:hypothetical protein
MWHVGIIFRLFADDISTVEIIYREYYEKTMIDDVGVNILKETFVS